MKKRITLFVSFLAIVFALLSQSPVKADTTINFSQLSYTLDNYSESEVAISYTTVGFTEIATITDKNSGEILEEISFTPDLTRGQSLIGTLLETPILAVTLFASSSML